MPKYEALHLDEDLIKRLPLPLAQICRRALNAKSALERHQAAYYCWEIALKLLASAAIVEYAELNDNDPQLIERLRNLARPALGHWWEFVRRLVPILAERNDEGFRAIRDLIFTRAREDLPRCCGLDAALRGVLENQSGSRSTVRPSELFDRLVQYRNQEMGHGASGQKPNSFYEQMTAAFIAALGELLDRLDVLAKRKLIFVADVRKQANGAWLVERLELSGDAARRIESIVLPEKAAAEVPRPDLIYLERPADAKAGQSVALPMHPLMLFDGEKAEVLFLNSQKGKKNAEFLCYHTGNVDRRDLLGDRRELFVKIFGPGVDSDTIASWVAKDVAAEAESEEPSRDVRMLGEFELLSKIDQGGMGVVYRAWQPSLGRPVALKSLVRFGDPKSEQRFAREIHALGRVEHPNVVKIFTSASDHEHWYYAMELVEGASLAGICAQLAKGGRTDVGNTEWLQAASTASEQARKKELPLTTEEAITKSVRIPRGQLQEALRAHPKETSPGTGALRADHSHIYQIAEIGRQIAEAAQALHEAGIIHRDIKPGNIMLTTDGQRAVLTDLGLAQLSDDAEGRLTKTRQFVGTLRYAPPEQLLASGVDRRADVYSLGATLWELLTFRPLFDATEETPSPELMNRIQTQAPERPSKINPRVPQDLETIVLKCLRKDSHHRYASAQELADDLGRFLRGEPVLAQPPTLGYIFKKHVHKHRMRIAALAATLLVLICGAIFAFVQVSLARNKAVKALAGEAVARTDAETHLQREQEANAQLSVASTRVKHVLAETYLQSGMNDCLNQQPGLGLASLLAAYEAAPPDDPLRWSLRLLMAGWERGLATRFLDEKEMEAVAFHPGGEMVMTAGRDGTAYFWDRKTGLLAGKPVSPGSKIWSATFSPKGEYLATGDDDGNAILWNVSTREQVGQPMPHPRPGRVRTLAFSPDGKILATGCGDSLLRLADIVPQKPMGDARLWDVATQQPIGHPMPHGKEVLCLAFSPDGNVLATGCEDKVLRFWDVKTQKMIGEPIKLNAGVWTVSYSPNGKYLFVGDWGEKEKGGVGRLYDAKTHQLIRDNIRHKKGIIASVFTNDSEQIFVGSRDATARFWNVDDGLPVGDGFSSLRSIPSVAVSPDPVDMHGEHSKPHAKEFMSCSRDCVARLFRDSTPRPIGVPLVHPKGVVAMAISPDGALLATACKDGIARLWNISSGTRLGKDMKHDGPINGLALSRDGSLLVTVGEDKTIRQWHATTGEPAAEPIRYKVPIGCVALFPERPWAVIGARADHAAQIVDLSTGKLVHEPMRHGDAVRVVAVSPDGKFVITGSNDNTIRLWDSNTSLPVSEKVMDQTDHVLALAIDRSGKLLLSGGADNTARLWNLADQNPLRALPTPGSPDGTGHQHDVYSVAFNPDSTIIVTGGGPDDRTTRLWDVATGQKITDALSYESAVNALTFAPDGSRYAVARESGVVEFWPTPQPVPDEPDRIHAWIRARTLWAREGTGHRRLKADEWRDSVKKLAELGGPFPGWDGK
ncbi:MAG TPA: protein kinase [Gemmataceae bacterium]|nr:protein kinase [Gemmataceae bacterium]